MILTTSPSGWVKRKSSIITLLAQLNCKQYKGYSGFQTSQVLFLPMMILDERWNLTDSRYVLRPEQSFKSQYFFQSIEYALLRSTDCLRISSIISSELSGEAKNKKKSYILLM